MRSAVKWITALAACCIIWVHCLTPLCLGQERSIKRADRRVALIIGNGAYAKTPLKNTVNDARDMAARLKTMGFDLIHKENADIARTNHRWKRGDTDNKSLAALDGLVR